MTEQQIKQLICIDDWSELDNPEQFFKLMSHYYDLAPGVQSKITAKINDINGMADKFKEYCASNIMDYEPSIMMALSKQIDDIKAAVGSTNKVRGPEKRQKISYLYKTFSEWFAIRSEVRCQLGKSDFVCNVADAITLAGDSKTGENSGDLSMILMTGERESIMKEQDQKLFTEMDFDIEMLAELLGEEAEPRLGSKKKKKYIM